MTDSVSGNVQKPKRKLWPWFLGGCLLLIVLVIGGIFAAGYWGISKLGEMAQAGFEENAVVIEQFGEIQNVSMNFAASGENNGQFIVFDVEGEKGKGSIAMDKDAVEQGGAGRLLIITTPNGEVIEVDLTGGDSVQMEEMMGEEEILNDESMDSMSDESMDDSMEEPADEADPAN